MNNEPDFSKYSYYELLDVVANIDQKKYPDRYNAAVTNLSNTQIPEELIAPINFDDVTVYADFWTRLGAALVDFLIFVPIFALVASQFTSPSSALMAVGILSIIAQAYTIYFHYKFGATIGKMAFRIKVTLLNGDKIGIRQALLRSSVDVAFVVLMLVAEAIAFSEADPDIYSNLDWMKRTEYMMLFFPAWYGLIKLASQFWYWGEFIVLLFNKKKRAIHDFIAGTVVIYQEFASRT